MTLIATTARYVVTMAISMIMILTMMPTGVIAFAVHPQRGPSSPVHHFTRSTNYCTNNKRTHSLVTLNRSLDKSASTTVLSSAVLPGIGPFVAAAIIPTCLGFWRTGYAVSYGYGGAMLASGLLQLIPSIRDSQTLPLLQAALYIFYGARLCGFLLYRECKLPEEIHQIKTSDASLAERLKRLPVIMGCSVLYFCMAAAPMRTLVLVNPKNRIMTMATLVVGFAGFLLAAVGDWYKCKIKARDGAHVLVTSGPFRYFRHPNYTGEMIGWTCACLLLPAIASVWNVRRVIPWLISSVVGWAGIVFGVLAGEATGGLERKQREKYGGTPEYEEWIKSSWSGPMLGGSDADAPTTNANDDDDDDDDDDVSS